MKNPFPNRSFSPFLAKSFKKSCRSSVSGVALVIVLVMLTLMAILLIAFLTSASTELRSAKSYAVGLDVRALSDSAVNIVISQIQDATSAPTNAWASQPGMIRTYDTTGTAVMAYKLYSADQMRVTGTFNPSSGTDSSTDVPVNWSTLPDQYTDLNKPVKVSGVSHYPIVDPAAVATSQSSTTAMDGTTAPIQGCYLDTANAATGTTTTQTNPVPMPVKWLYVLQDGTIATIASSGTISNTSGSPIVGRIAFWTDDECSKVNVNTSGEGTFWDRPHTESSSTLTGYSRVFLGTSIPLQNEFQRYPGHPATTSLSTIFPPLAGESTHDYNERIYGIIPRLGQGGTQSGTVATSTATTAAAQPVPNTSRLFSSMDEFFFSGTNTASPRTANLKGPGIAFTDSDIEKTRFFLTANSRAPEVNMFNKPRITLWPLQANTTDPSHPLDSPNRTAKDKLIAFCSTMGKTTPYYFQRYSTFDTNQATAQAAPVPSSQSATQDWSNIPRNQALYAYLQSLTSLPIPGVGGSFSGTGGKYSTSVRDQILTEMVDFIRSDITTATTGTITPNYFYAPGIPTGSVITGERQVVPLQITPPGASYTTKGFGRFETIEQAALVFYRMDKPTILNAGLINHSYIQSPPEGGITPATPANIGVVLVMQPFSPSPGSRPWCENVRYVVRGLSSMKINTVALTTPFPDPAVLLLNAKENISNATAWFGPEFFFQYNGGFKTLGPAVVGAANEAQSYTLFGSTTVTAAPGQVVATSTTTPPSNGAFTFTPPSSITISVYPGYDPNVTQTSLLAETPAQTINMTFIPPGSTVLGQRVNLPMPTAIASMVATASGTITNYTEPNIYYNYNNRPPDGIEVGGQHNPAPLILGGNSADGDVVRSIEARSNYGNTTTPCPAKGDMRIYSGLTNVPPDYFESHGQIDTPAEVPALHYNDIATSSKIIHSIRMFDTPGDTISGPSYGAYSAAGGPQGTLIWDAGSTNVANYFQGKDASTISKTSLYPCVPRGVTPAQVMLTGLNGNLYPGDWDTGPGRQMDGPYINKPDESSANDYGVLFTDGSDENGGNKELDEQGVTYSPNRQVSSAVIFGSLPTGIDQLNPDTAGSTINSGSQATGGIRPWQTLLFCANPASESNPGTSTGNTGAPRHPGFGYNGTTATNAPPYTVPPDNALLDFFTMPVVEPYAISEPFSTAGKINMNYQIAPFTYLTRDTAVRAVLKSVRMMAIPQTDKGSTSSGSTPVYKLLGNYGPPPQPDYTYTINPDELSGTLAGFQQRFNSGDIFRSAAEICNVYLVPQYAVGLNPSAPGGELVSATVAAGTPTYSTMNKWWSNYALTGDNVREAPYGFIYPRLTTKSNAYTVHVICQTLKKVPGTPTNQFISGQDLVTSEYRGSYIVQRYLDPNSDSLVLADGVTPGTETDPNSMVGPYKFRVVGTKRFAP